MSNELNVTSGEATGTAAEPAAGESTGVTSDNKIVPIANKTGAAEPGIATETVVPAAVQPVAAPVVNNSSDGTVGSNSCRSGFRIGRCKPGNSGFCPDGGRQSGTEPDTGT